MQKEYILKKDGTKVPIEAWKWEAVYNDGTILTQFDDRDGTFHQIGEVEFEKVSFFEMVNVANPDLRYSIEKTDEITKFVHFYRNFIFNAATPHETRARFYCFGCVIKGITIYNFILPDNRIVTTTNRDIKLVS